MSGVGRLGATGRLGGAEPGVWRPGTPDLLRFDAAHAPKLFNGLAAVRAGSADLRIVQMGHSQPQGFRSNVGSITGLSSQYGGLEGEVLYPPITPQAFPSVMAEALSAQLGIVVRTSGWFGDGSGSTSTSSSAASNGATCRARSDPRLGVPYGVTPGEGQYAAYWIGTSHWTGQAGTRLGGHRMRNAGSTNRFRFTDAGPVDTVEVYYGQTTAGGTLSIGAANGAAVATQDVTGTDGVSARRTVTLGTRAIQSADVWRSAGTVDIEGMIVTDSTIRQATVINVARQGSRITDWNAAGPMAQLGLIAPDVVMMQVDLNEWLGNINPATFKTGYQGWITAVQALASAPDIVLMVSSPPDPATVRTWAWDDYRQAIQELAADNELTLVDWGGCVGHDHGRATAAGLIQPLDGLHWLTSFHAHAGRRLAEAIAAGVPD